MQEQAFLPLAASTGFPLVPGTQASLLQLPAGTQDPGWLLSSPGLVRKDIWNDVRKMSALISILPFYYYRFPICMSF